MAASFTYARAQFDASAYHPVSDRVVVAGRIRLGTIVGAGVFDIAPSRRFYSGGGGSVRGYGYQQLGPKDVDGDPIGGRGLAEFALEARIRLKQFGGNFGIVPFFDGGSLTTAALPDLEALALTRPASASAIIRASARSASTSACRSTARRVTGRSRSPSRWARPSDGRGAVAERRIDRTATAPAAVATGRGGCSTSCSRCSSRLLFLLAGAAGPARHRARPPLHRRPASAGSRPRRACKSASAGSTDRSSASRSCGTSRSPTSRGVFLTSPNIKLDWAPGAWLDNKLHDRQPDRRAGRP